MRGGGTVFWIWGASLVLVWIAVALSLNQPLFMRQHSTNLVAFGAFKGADLSWVISWKLLASQWLHVKFPHMVFNGLIIGSVGAALSRRAAWPWVFFVGLMGGAVGQWVGAMAQPEAFISGASQAYLALCGLALFVLQPLRATWWVAVVGVLISVALDVFVAKFGGYKPGHLAALCVGLAIGAGVWASTRWASKRHHR